MTGSWLDVPIAIALIAAAAVSLLTLAVVAVLAVVYDRGEQVWHACYVHTCSYGCGEPTEECGQPCSQCAADEAESDAWLGAHRHLSPEERLLGTVQLSHEQSKRRRACDVHDIEAAESRDR